MNFLQKGLAGLESRLDKVLLDEGHVPATTTATTTTTAAATTSLPTAALTPSSPPKPSPLSAAIPGVVDGRRDVGKGKREFLFFFFLFFLFSFFLRTCGRFWY